MRLVWGEGGEAGAMSEQIVTCWSSQSLDSRLTRGSKSRTLEHTHSSLHYWLWLVFIYRRIWLVFKKHIPGSTFYCFRSCFFNCFLPRGLCKLIIFKVCDILFVQYIFVSSLHSNAYMRIWFALKSEVQHRLFWNLKPNLDIWKCYINTYFHYYNTVSVTV